MALSNVEFSLSQALIRVGLAPSGDDPLPTTQRRSVNEVTVWAESR